MTWKETKTMTVKISCFTGNLNHQTKSQCLINRSTKSKYPAKTSSSRYCARTLSSTETMDVCPLHDSLFKLLFRRSKRAHLSLARLKSAFLRMMNYLRTELTWKSLKVQNARLIYRCQKLQS